MPKKQRGDHLLKEGGARWQTYYITLLIRQLKGRPHKYYTLCGFVLQGVVKTYERTK